MKLFIGLIFSQVVIGIIYMSKIVYLVFVYVFKNGSIKFKILKNYKPHYIGKNSSFRITEICTFFFLKTFAI